MTNRLNPFLLVTLAAISLLSSAISASQFWVPDIDSALQARNLFLEDIKLTEQDFSSLQSWINSQQQQFSSRLSTADPRSPWYHYLAGLLQPAESENRQSAFQKALALSGKSPGTLWLFSLEFIRSSQFPWAQRSLEALEKEMYISGATSVPTISQQLLLAGNLFEKDSREQSELCYSWAKRFDPQQSWSSLQQVRLCLPQKPVTALGYTLEATKTLSQSWVAQHSLILHLYRTFRIAAFLFIIVFFAVFVFKYLPSASHFLDDKVFSGLPLRFRSPASIAMLLAFASFGILPLFWILTFFMLRFMSKTEKKLLIALCLLVIFSPVENWIYSKFLHSAGPTSSPTIFTRVNSEGYSTGLHEQAMQNANNNPSDYLAQLSVALSAVKGQDYQLSADALRKALQLSAKDPLTLLSAGNLSFLLGNKDAVEPFYIDLINKHPRNMLAKFNLGQFQIERGGSINATALIDEAAKINPEKVNSFIMKNDQYFSGDNPSFRKLMQPEISPLYFWTKLFWKHGGTFGASKDIWGNNFLGFSPLVSIFFFLLLFILLMFLDTVVWSKNSKVKELFKCKVCGRIICRRCRKGTMCQSCHDDSLYSKTAAALNAQQRLFEEKRHARKLIFRSLFGMIVPGSDELIKGEKLFMPILVTAFSCTVFAVYFTSIFGFTRYPENVTLNLIVLFSFLFLYNFFNLIKHGRVLLQNLSGKKK